MGVRIEVQSLWTEEPRPSFVYEFDQARVVIGRSRSADVQLPHAAVSGTHASIRTRDSGYVLVDEDSTNGSRVNEALVVPGREKSLHSFDRIDLGGYQLTVHVGVPVAETTSARSTTEYAEQMLRKQHPNESEVEFRARLAAIQSSADESIELLPISQDAPSAPPPPTSLQTLGAGIYVELAAPNGNKRTHGLLARRTRPCSQPARALLAYATLT